MPCPSRRREAHTGAGEDRQVEVPVDTAPSAPDLESTLDVVLGVGPRPVVDGDELCECLVASPLDLGQSEVRRAVARRAETDQAQQPLDARGRVVVAALVGLHPLTLLPVRGSAAYLTPVARSCGDHPTQPFPVLRAHAGADVGEPARRRDEVDEQPSAKGPVLTCQQIGHR